MNRKFTIRRKLLLLGLLPLGLVSLLFLSALARLQEHSLDTILVNDRDAAARVWQQLVAEQGHFLEFSGAIIRQSQPLLQALRQADSEAIAQHSDNIWNQLRDRVDALLFWHAGPIRQRLLYWVAREPGPVETGYTTPLLEQVATTRRAATGLAWFPDGRLRLMYAVAYFNAPGKPYNLAAQGMDLQPMADRLAGLMGASSAQVMDHPLAERHPIHIDEKNQTARYHLPLHGVDGLEIGYLEIHKDLARLIRGFTLARQVALAVAGLVILLTGLAVLGFVRGLVQRLSGLQDQMAAISRGEIHPLAEPVQPDELDLLTYGIYQQGCRLEETHRKLMLATEHRAREAESRLTLHKLLETSLAMMSLNQQLEALLDIIFSVPWFSLDPRGAIFLLDPATNQLELKAHRGFCQKLLTHCRRVAVGHCLCGQAAQTGQTVFTNHLDARHQITFDSMTDHGHYCVPIRDGVTVIGVINLYVAANHERRSEEDEFLQSVAVTIASLIQRRQLEDQVKQQAEFDLLTGLPNRALFQSRLARAIGQANRTHTELVLMLIDLDRFKQVNDTLGHKAGDQLLQEASRRIVACVRATDTVARLGGDEFSIILPKITHQFYVEYVARRMIEQLSLPFHLDQGEVDVSCSIGITLYPDDAMDLDRLVMNADTAMYAAKQDGRATFRFFKTEMNVQAMRRLEIEKALKIALAEGQLVVHYQAKVDPVRHVITGMEALARWHRPGIGLVSPAEFIPVAEQSGLILPMGERILEMACQQNKAWLDAGWGSLVVSVNLSPRQFRLGDRLVHTVREILARSGLPAHLLELEVTESMMMENMQDAVVLLNRIRDLGVKISVDDFGTGYSSLSSLKHLPIQTLKIDRSFITDLTTNDDSATIVSTIIALARQLNLRVVAEGVEREEEVNILKSQGCDEIQGYFYGKPCAAHEFEDFLARFRLSGSAVST